MDPEYFAYTELNHALEASTMVSRQRVRLELKLQISDSGTKILIGETFYPYSPQLTKKEELHLQSVLDGHLNGALNVDPLESGFLAETFSGLLRPWLADMRSNLMRKKNIECALGGHKWLA